MPKDTSPNGSMNTQELQMMLQTVIEQSRKTGETTTAIHLTVQDLRQVLALTARPEEQDIALGQSLEQALIRMLERLEEIERSQAHLVRSQTESNDQLGQIVTTQEALDRQLSQLETGQAKILTSLEKIAGLAQGMQRIDAALEQLQADINHYFADPFPEEDSPGQ